MWTVTQIRKCLSMNPPVSPKWINWLGPGTIPSTSLPKRPLRRIWKPRQTLNAATKAWTDTSAKGVALKKSMKKEEPPPRDPILTRPDEAQQVECESIADVPWIPVGHPVQT